MYPTGAVSPKYYGLPKIHKPGIPLRPIISSTGTVTYNTAKELAKILKPLVGLASHHVHNTKDFIDHIKEVRLRQGESIISYDVTSLFTSVPIQPVLNNIQQRLATDQDLKNRTSMTIQHIINQHQFCIPGPILPANGGCSNGQSTKPYSGQHIYGAIWKRSLGNSSTPPKSVEKICRWHFCHSRR